MEINFISLNWTAESRSDDLLKVVLKIIDNRQCAPLYVDQINRRRLRNGIVDTQMCAGELDGGKDTCQVKYYNK